MMPCCVSLCGPGCVARAAHVLVPRAARPRPRRASTSHPPPPLRPCKFPQVISRVSTLFRAGAHVVPLIARRLGLTVEEVAALVHSHGESCAHLDGNDTGAGGLEHNGPTWGKADVEAAGFTYVYGAEGLADGRHRGELLMHLVMVIAYKCTPGEAQALLAMDEGSSTCLLTFPPEADDKYDGYRIFIYGCDYSYFLHGNPVYDADGARAMHPDAWAFRVTPYGTTHAATWARILRSTTESDPELARQLMRSMLVEPGAPALGELAGRLRRVHGEVRPGAEPVVTPEGLREGLYARLTMIPTGSAKAAEAFVAEGQVLRTAAGWFVGATRYDPLRHALEVVPLPSRRGQP